MMSTNTDFSRPALHMYGTYQPPQNEIPRYVQYTSPVSVAPTGDRARAATLPLNLIAIIVSYLDDFGDIARVTRTSKLLYYMTLPSLYQRVCLHSYSEIRYVEGRPAGFGSGSPFMMALNGLVTKPHASLVQDFRLWGQWRERGVEDYAEGRVPDNSMMLNILLRAATDKMLKLQRFSWELDCKPLHTLYQGLAAHSTLISLNIKFPDSRVPRPSVMIPPIPSLRVLKVTDIDPMCYPDDISMLLLHSKKLVDVRIHFSSRMRREAEPTLSFDTYFGRCQKANYCLPVKHFGMQNFFGMNPEGLSVFDSEKCKSWTFLDCVGGANSSSRNVFIDDTWKNIPRGLKTDFRTVRCNEAALQHVDMISAATGLEHVYFVGTNSGSFGDSPAHTKTPMTPNETPPAQPQMAQLGKDYMHALTRKHGSTLKHLLLSDQWSVSPDDLAELIRWCPNLEQLGLALNTHNADIMRLLLPFLTKLKAIRILPNAWLTEFLKDKDPEADLTALGRDLYKSMESSVRIIGIGDRIFRVTGNTLEATLEDGSKEMRREIVFASPRDFQDLEIWRLDTLDISADPIAPFTP